MGNRLLLIIFVGFCLLAGLGWSAEGWKLALPGWEYEFPRDHHSHAGFKTEWWYFTGNLECTKSGREFGYQLTFFRHGITPGPRNAASRFITSDLAFAHFAVSDLDRKTYRHFSRWNRGAFDEVGFSDGDRIVWIQDWELSHPGEGRFVLRAAEEDIELSLETTARKPPVFHGADGISQKAEGEGRASHYYSFTRLESSGSLRLGEETFQVRGWSWYDHEWATNQLTEEQEGWDWFSLQFEDDTELMVFQIRLRDGGIDPFSSGTWVAEDGQPTALKKPDFVLEPTEFWKSPDTGARYPVRWNLEVPSLDLQLTVRARMEQQEFLHPPIFYWEGAILAEGSHAGQPVRAKGYLEMTGYAGPIVGMQAPATQ